MASVMAIESDVFGSCVGGIDVEAGIENRGVWLCCGWKYMRFILGVKSDSISALEVGDGDRYWKCF